MDGSKDYKLEVETALSYKVEAELARSDRMKANENNFNCYHRKQDFSYKIDGQSREFLPKQSIAVEQLVASLKQGLIDQQNWFKIDQAPGYIDNSVSPISPDDMQKLLNKDLERTKFPVLFDDALKLGFLGSLMITKVYNKYTKTLSSISVSKTELGQKVPSLKFSRYMEVCSSNVRQENFFIDPTGRRRYIIERIEMDWCDLWSMVLESPGVYNIGVVEKLKNNPGETDKTKATRETGQNMSSPSEARRRVVYYELWGDIIHPTEGHVLHENCQFIFTDNGDVIMPPRRNPFWHQRYPYVISPIIRTPNSEWHKALMDAPTDLNHALNELFNLMLDEGLLNVHGIGQVREDWLEDPSEVSGGIKAGSTLRINSSAPLNAKVYERLVTTVQASNAFSVFNLVNGEILDAAVSNDLRLGSLPQRQVKATEIVAAERSINTLMTGIVNAIETVYTKEYLELRWLTMAQFIDEYDPMFLASILGEEKKNSIIALGSAEIFSKTAIGKSYSVFGLSAVLNKMNDFKKITTLLQTIGVSPELLAAFRSKYSMTKLLGEVIVALDINEDKIKASDKEIQQANMENALRLQVEMAKTQPKGENQQSQITQMRNTSDTPTGAAIPQEIERGSGERP